MVRGIVGFRFVITRLEGKWKINQYRGAQDRLGVAKGLSERGRADDLEMADLVARSIAGTTDAWSAGRTAILSDAAHVPPPNLRLRQATHPWGMTISPSL